MNEFTHPLVDLLQRDPRYPLEAYQFVRESLSYAQDVLDSGGVVQADDEDAEQHLTGQQLCRAFRSLAQEQFGLMARTVLNTWGVHSTNDIGEIVYNLIDIGVMRHSPHDRREDFDEVYVFSEAFDQGFEITVPRA